MPLHPAAVAPAEGGDIGTKKLGEDPETGLDVTVRSGRFGPYLQLGEDRQGRREAEARRPAERRGARRDRLSSSALKLLSLPREVGTHPEDGEPIRAGIGRFGPYVQHGKIYANLESPEEVFTIGLNRAVTLIAEKIAKGPRKGRFGADPGRALGDHPTKGGPIVAKKGRYGPYVSHDGVNATLPADKTPETVTLDEAVALIDARAERNGPRAACAPAQGQARRRRAPRAHVKASLETAAARPRPANGRGQPPRPPRKTTQAAE